MPTLFQAVLDKNGSCGGPSIHFTPNGGGSRVSILAIECNARIFWIGYIKRIEEISMGWNWYWYWAQGRCVCGYWAYWELAQCIEYIGAAALPTIMYSPPAAASQSQQPEIGLGWLWKKEGSPPLDGWKLSFFEGIRIKSFQVNFNFQSSRWISPKRSRKGQNFKAAFNLKKTL